MFPRLGKPWAQEDLDLIHSIIADIPDDRIDDHILWLSKKLQRTPYAITLKIVSEGRMNEEWAKGWKPAAKSIREDFALVRVKTSANKTDNSCTIATHIKCVDKLAQIFGANMKFLSGIFLLN
ncbi:hypothetical protein [Enterobacter roggenkampii]|uniref:hypothetical protein n=1 Tax=Enterobacter roggenkampii TaxID=1812935 RepID=UPI001F05FE58|nr:hypothetical protein [Enterobacter roggenkampii]